jgi:cytochrome c oxidase assembly protein subunit 15
MTAYALLALAVLHVIDAVRSKAGAATVNGALALVAAIIVQAMLGILTLLYQVPILLGLAHQATAIAVLTLAVCQLERLALRQPELGQRKLALTVTPAG